MTGSFQNLTELDTLTPTQRIYVAARARGESVTDAAKAAGVTRQAVALWNADAINAAILAIQSILLAESARAVEHLVAPAINRLSREIKKGGMVGYLATKEVLDRFYGKSIQKAEIKTDGPIVVKVLNGVSMDDL